MKPRNAKERELVALAATLRPLSEKQKDFARSLFPAEALYYSRRGNNCEFYCMCCGTMVPTLGKWLIADYAVGKWKCPNCGADCEVLPQYSGGWNRNMDRKTGAISKSATNTKYVTAIDRCGEYTVFRAFEVIRWNGRSDTADGVHRGKPTEFLFYEIYQNWIAPDGKEWITSRRYTRGFNHHSWDYHSEWGVNRHNYSAHGYFEFEDVFVHDGNVILPEPRISPILRRNGMSSRVIRAVSEMHKDISQFAIALLMNAHTEELVKTGQIYLAAYFVESQRRDLRNYIGSIRVATRHGYFIKDTGMWLDYVDDLRTLQLDTRSPHYLCPADLRAAHAQMQKRRERKEALLEIKRKSETAARYEAKYAKDKAPFLEIAFGDDVVWIAVIPTVKAVLEEGCAMHHCVFNNGYYKDAKSVLLSARSVKDGSRLETVEIVLGKHPYVAQSRGLQNRPTDEHKRIVALCEAHLVDFVRAASDKKKTAV